MGNLGKSIAIWTLAVVVTLLAAVWQRVSGPTYEQNVAVTINGEEYSFELPRSHGGEEDCEISLTVPDPNIAGSIHFRRFPTDDPWETAALERRGEELIARLPHQPPAGKLQYYVTLSGEGEPVSIVEESPVVIRFRGGVPGLILIPHIVFIFAAMLISNLAGILAAARDQRHRFYTFLAFGLLLLGGMILGPIVQQFAFGELWTGVPFGWDLTDNKTLIAFAAYLVAVVGNRKGDRPYLTVAAALVVLLIFSIPHSMLGSELNYATGTVTTG